MTPADLAQSLDLPKRAIALVLAGGRGSAPDAASPTGAPSRRSTSAASSASSTSRCRTASIRASAASASSPSTSRTACCATCSAAGASCASEMNEFVDLLPAQQRIGRRALVPRHRRRGLPEPRHPARGYGAEYILVLAGDHIYKMDYALMLRGPRRQAAAAARSAASRCRAMEATRVRRDGTSTSSDRSSTSSKSRPSRRPCRATPTARSPAWASTSSTPITCTRRWTRDIADPASSHDFGKDIIPRCGARRAARLAHPFSLQLRRHPAGRRAVLARRRHGRCLLGRQPRPHRRPMPALDLYDTRLADLDLPGAAAAGQVRARPGRPARHGDRHRWSRAAASFRARVHRSVLFSSVRVHSYALVERSVLLPGVRGRPPRARCTASWSTAAACIPEGMVIGEDAERRRRRFVRTDGGITLVTREMLDRLRRVTAPYARPACLRRALPAAQDRRACRRTGCAAAGAGGARRRRAAAAARLPGDRRCRAAPTPRLRARPAASAPRRVAARLGRMPYSRMPVYVIDAPLVLRRVPAARIRTRRAASGATTWPASRCSAGSARSSPRARSIRRGRRTCCMRTTGTPR